MAGPRVWTLRAIFLPRRGAIVEGQMVSEVVLAAPSLKGRDRAWRGRYCLLKRDVTSWRSSPKDRFAEGENGTITATI